MRSAEGPRFSRGQPAFQGSHQSRDEDRHDGKLAEEKGRRTSIKQDSRQIACNGGVRRRRHAQVLNNGGIANAVQFSTTARGQSIGRTLFASWLRVSLFSESSRQVGQHVTTLGRQRGRPNCRRFWPRRDRSSLACNSVSVSQRCRAFATHSGQAASQLGGSAHLPRETPAIARMSDFAVSPPMELSESAQPPGKAAGKWRRMVTRGIFSLFYRSASNTNPAYRCSIGRAGAIH